VDDPVAALLADGGFFLRLTSSARSRTTPSDPTNGRAVTLAGHDEIERLQAELAEVRASRARLVRAADADRRSIERELHGGVQQHVVALAMRLQLAQSALDSDPAAAKALLEEISRDVQDAIDESARLARRIYVPLLELGFAAALRSASASAGVPASVEVSAGSACPPEILHTVYACWLEALEQPGDTRPAITVQKDARALLFEIVRSGTPSAARLDALRDRVEALGGVLTVRGELGGGARVSGSLPLSR
jgi:signal transduction histidine kinase